MERSLLLLVLVGTLATSASASASEPDRVIADFFEAKIRPILVENCYGCHSSQAKKLKGGLLLDTADGMRKAGRAVPRWFRASPRKVC